MAIGDRTGGMTDRSSASASSGVPASKSIAWFHEDFLGISLGTLGTNGTGTTNTNVSATAGGPGRCRFGVSAAATPDVASYRMGSAPGTAVPVVPGGGVGTFEIRSYITTLSNGVENITVRAGIADGLGGTVDQNNGIYFENDYANHGASSNWFACSANAGVRTKVDTGIAAVGVTFQRMTIATDATWGTSAQFKIGDVVVATITTNLPVAALAAGVQVVKQLGATLRNFECDFIDFQQAVAR